MSLNLNKKNLVFIFVLSFVFFSCSKAKVQVVNVENCQTEVSFSKDILPIMESNCVGCHNSKNPSAGFDLSNYKGVSNKPSIVLSSVKQDGSAKSMPLSYKLADSLIQKINCWIYQGSKNN